MLNFFKTTKPHLELAARIYVCCMLSAYGLGKIVGGQFYRVGKIPEEIAQTPLAEVGSYDLMWTFFGHSFPYILFIGSSQLIGGFLLLFEKTKLFGVAILLTILLNIIVANICFGVSWGAVSSAVSYSLALSFIAFCNREKIVKAFVALTKTEKKPKQKFPKKLLRLGIAVGIVAIIIATENQMLNIIGR